MNLSPYFMEMWSFATIHCLNFNVQRRKRHDFTNDVKVNILIYGLVRCMKNMIVLSNILFNILSMEFLGLPKWGVCRNGLNRSVNEGMKDISNVKVHSKTCSGNVNIH